MIQGKSLHLLGALHFWNLPQSICYQSLSEEDVQLDESPEWANTALHHSPAQSNGFLHLSRLVSWKPDNCFWTFYFSLQKCVSRSDGLTGKGRTDVNICLQNLMVFCCHGVMSIKAYFRFIFSKKKPATWWDCAFYISQVSSDKVFSQLCQDIKTSWILSEPKQRGSQTEMSHSRNSRTPFEESYCKSNSQCSILEMLDAAMDSWRK